jgi:small subunit ribosomal protein S6
VCTVLADLREYELMYILRPNLGDEALPPAVEKVNQLIANHGGEVYEILQTPPWGRRRLAYPIDRHTEGYYIVNHLRMDPNQSEDVESQLKISDDVIRHMLIRMDL